MSRRASSNKLVSLLIALFPREFRQRYAEDMRDLFDDQLRAARASRGNIGALRAAMAASIGLVRAAFAEHRAALTPQSTRRPAMLENTRNDLRFAARMLRKSPIFTIVAILAISLGAGAVATIFSAMNAMVLRPLPGTADGTRLVGLQFVRPDGGAEISASLGTYRRLRDENHSMSGVAAWGRVALSITDGASAAGAVVAGNYASGNYFSVLGLRPALGRFFLPEEDGTPETHPVVVVSHAFWSTRLGGDSSIVGRTINVSGHPYTLIGVAPRGFRGVISLIPVDAWIPTMMQSQVQPGRDLATARWLRLFGRLADGASLETAQAELSTIVKSEALAVPTGNAKAETARLAMLRSVPEDARGQFLAFMMILLAASGLVLFIASADVAAMLSARAIARRREMALRAALGASRARLVTQLLTEILLLFGMGAVGAVGFAFAATRLATRVSLPTDVVVPPDMSPDFRVMGFALSTSLITGLIFGLMPALRASRDDASATLRDGGAQSGTRRGRFGNALIVGQLALSLVLLVSAGLFFRAVDIGSRVEAGFDRKNVWVASFDTRTWGFDDERGRRFVDALHDRVAKIPGMSSVALASFAPLTTRSMNDDLLLADGSRVHSWLTNVSAEYFDALRMPIVAGRPFTNTDDMHSARVAVVNETLARRLAPNGDALGRRFHLNKTDVTVIGVARDAKYAAFDETTPAMVFSPLGQVWQSNQTLLMRFAGSEADLARALRDAMRAVDAAVPAPSPMSLERASDITVLPQRIAVIVTGVLGGVGLLLAALGLYGVIAYSVTRRTREMGVRMALGARGSDVLTMVIHEGARLAGIGILIGLALAAAATRVIAKLLIDVSALDPWTFGATSLLLLVIALVAAYIPARRAALSNPMSALRAD